MVLGLSLLLCALVGHADESSAVQALKSDYRKFYRKYQSGHDHPSERIPPATVPLLSKVKQDLLALVIESIQSAPAIQKGTDLQSQIRSQVSDALSASDEEEAPKIEVGVEVSEVPAQKDLFSVVTQIELDCGSDDSYYLIQRKAGVAKVLYAKVRDVSADLYASSVARLKGGMISVVSAWIPLHCNSAIQSVEVIAAQSSTLDSEVIVDKDRFERGIFLTHEGVSLSSDPSGFTLKYEHAQSLDFETSIRKHIEKYRWEGDLLRRVAPIAFDSKGFVDEWFRLNWSDASRFAEGKKKDLEAWHAKGKGFSQTRFGRTRACGKSGAQVLELKHEESPIAYLVVAGGADYKNPEGMRLRAVEAKFPMECK